MKYTLVHLKNDRDINTSITNILNSNCFPTAMSITTACNCHRYTRDAVKQNESSFQCYCMPHFKICMYFVL